MFTVQGDGRGHMTQAIACKQLLEHQGHEIVAVTVGKNPSRTVPEFFTNAFGDRVVAIESPGFSFQGGRGVSTMATVRQAFCGLGRFRRSLATIAETVEHAQPDVIVNFLEPLTGVFNLLRPHGIPVVSLGHQFMLGHPEFVSTQKYGMQQRTMRLYVGMSGARSTKLALSFYAASPVPERNILVCPPLLREEVFQLPRDRSDGFLLAYVLNQGYAQDIIRWHEAHPEVEIHCFCEKPKVEPVWRYDAMLTFHKLDGAKFLQMMARSAGVACTAGFESLNEAAWLGKPLLVVPVKNHVEQYLNGLDAQKAGLAVMAEGFDLSPLLAIRNPGVLDTYRNWVRKSGPIFLSVIEDVVRPTSPRLVPAYSAAA
jgi:uncharacterized protein (TIGR00661 family)